MPWWVCVKYVFLLLCASSLYNCHITCASPLHDTPRSRRWTVLSVVTRHSHGSTVHRVGSLSCLLVTHEVPNLGPNSLLYLYIYISNYFTYPYLDFYSYHHLPAGHLRIFCGTAPRLIIFLLFFALSHTNLRRNILPLTQLHLRSS